MNVSYLQTNLDALLNHMRISGYSVSTIKACRSTSNYVIRLSSELSWAGYDDVRAWISENEAFSEQYRKNLQFSVAIIERYDIYHELPVHPANQNQMSFRSHSAGDLDLLQMQEKMHDFEKSMTDKGFQKEYIKKIKQIAAKIIVTARTVPWDSFDAIRQYYKDSNMSDGTKKSYQRTINKIEAFLNSGRVPCHGVLKNKGGMKKMKKHGYYQNRKPLSSRQIARKQKKNEPSQIIDRDQFEHCEFPMLFYREGDAMINACTGGGGKFLYDLYNGLSYDAKPYTAHTDFDVTPRRYKIGNDGSDVLIVRLSLPKATKVTECRNIYLCKNNKTGDLMYITSELSEPGPYFLCAWTRQHSHLLFTLEEEPDEFRAAAERFWEFARFEPTPDMPGFNAIPVF